MTASETGKAERHFCLAQADRLQLLVLKCCIVLIPLFARKDASQTDNWQSVF
jgi:hypothetical protein